MCAVVSLLSTRSFQTAIVIHGAVLSSAVLEVPGHPLAADMGWRNQFSVLGCQLSPGGCGIGAELFWASLEHKAKVEPNQEWQQYLREAA